MADYAPKVLFIVYVTGYLLTFFMLLTAMVSNRRARAEVAKVGVRSVITMNFTLLLWPLFWVYFFTHRKEYRP